MLQETIDAHKVLIESRSDARIKVLLVERSTSFPPFLTSYVGIRTFLPEILKVTEILSNRPSTKNPSASTNIQKETTALNDNINDCALSDLKISNADIKDSCANIKAQLSTLIGALASPKSTRAPSTSVFPPVSKATFVNEIDGNSDNIETKTETTDILITDKINKRHFSPSTSQKVPTRRVTSVFPRFSNPYVGIRRSVPALLAADSNFFPVG
eukprot:scaffold39339_cov27-Attheya_sp.AAC.1